MRQLEKSEHVNFFALLENQAKCIGEYNLGPEKMFSGIKSDFCIFTSII